jgi:microcystin-dependent protein
MQTRKKTFKIALWAALAGSTMLGNVPASHATCATDPYIGSVCMTAANFCPRGYLAANGQLVPVVDNTALFSLLGTTYGGDGRSTFGVPDLRGRTPVGAGSGLGLTQVLLGARRGAETRTLSLATLPAHIHEAAFEPVPGGGLKASTATGGSPSPSTNSFLGAMKAAGMGNAPSLYTTDGSKLTSIQGLDIDGGIEIATTGQGQPFAIIPPQLGLLYCIAAQGMFPPRP